jgi:hypothetical protein
MKTRDICGVDKRCAYALRRIMMSLVEKGLARRYKRGIYLNREESCRGSHIGSKEVDMTATAKKVRTIVSVFELPQKLGILQYIEYEPLPREWCTDDGCLHEGVLATEECRKGICLRYCV